MRIKRLKDKCPHTAFDNTGSSLLLQQRPLQNKCVARSSKLDPNDLWMITHSFPEENNCLVCIQLWNKINPTCKNTDCSFNVKGSGHGQERQKENEQIKKKDARNKEQKIDWKTKEGGSIKKNERKTEKCSIARDHPPAVHQWASTPQPGINDKQMREVIVFFPSVKPQGSMGKAMHVNSIYWLADLEARRMYSCVSKWIQSLRHSIVLPCCKPS